MFRSPYTCFSGPVNSAWLRVQIMKLRITFTMDVGLILAWYSTCFNGIIYVNKVQGT
jgi:hypothetical protein